MASVLDQDWNQLRGMEIQAVGIASISYDEKSQELINLRNEGAMLSDPNVQRGYMVGHMARGMEAAGSNEAGAMNAFLGMGMGMNMQGNILGQMPVGTPQQPMQAAPQMAAAPQPAPAVAPAPAPAAQPTAGTWTCTCGNVNSGKFCPECGNPAPAADWTCECGTVNSGKFCSECGKPRA